MKETALTAAEAQAALARNQMAYATLVADRAGVIVAVLAEPGQVVAAGQPVFRLAPDGEREVEINLAETEVAHFTLGMPAQVSLWAQGRTAAPLAGKIREITPLADPVTRTYAVRVALPDADPRLPLGLTASVRFPEASRQKGEAAFRLPLAAVFQQGARMAVWIVGADDTVSLRPVTVAELADDGAWVTAGLNAGERIVAAGVHKLTAGEKVRLAEAAPASAK
jgi:RND family efflux transporter MFP subunit